jgi:hypothetical protein
MSCRPFCSSGVSMLSLALVLLVALSVGNVYAQQNNTPAEKSKLTNEELKKKAIDLLESLATQIGTLQSAENRARIGSNIAASLWTHDEQRARSVLKVVQDDLNLVLQSSDTIVDSKDQYTFMVFLKLREDTIERIAKHDAELALAFLKATEPRPGKSQPLDAIQRERDLESRVAKQVATGNPDLALKLGRQSLERGFSEDLLHVLWQLHKKHREHGVTLYKEILVKLRNSIPSQDYEAIYFAQDLANSIRPPIADESSFRELISILLRSALENGCAAKLPEDDDVRIELCSGFASLVEQMAKIDPSRAARLKNLRNEDFASDEIQVAHFEIDELVRDGTVEELLALAEKYPNMQAVVFSRALMKARASGDLEKARKIAAEYPGDSATRQYILADIDRAEKAAQLSEEELAEVQRGVSKMIRIQDQVTSLVSLANRISGNNRTAALKLLDQATGIVDAAKPSKEQTEARIWLAVMYSLEKSDRGLAMMESVMPRLNELIDAAAKLDGYDTRYLRDGEWNMSADGSLGALLTDLANSAGYFAWRDFDRAVGLAAQFERAEIRMMAQLKLAQGILAGPPPRSFRRMISY